VRYLSFILLLTVSACRSEPNYEGQVRVVQSSYGTERAYKMLREAAHQGQPADIFKLYLYLGLYGQDPSLSKYDRPSSESLLNCSASGGFRPALEMVAENYAASDDPVRREVATCLSHNGTKSGWPTCTISQSIPQCPANL
jgi:hypothetical protein